MRSTMRRVAVLVSVLCLAVAVSIIPTLNAAAGAAPEWKTREYLFAGWPSSAGQFLFAAITWSLISRDTGLRVTVLETAGTEENMHQLQNKRADIAHYDAAVVKRVFGDKWDGRQMIPFAPGVWQFAVAKDANIKSLKDLNGKKWNPGPAGGGSTKVSMEVMDLLGIKPIYHQATLGDAAAAYADRQIVGFSYRGTGGEPTSAMVEAHAARPLTFVSLTDEEIAKVLAKWPDLSKFQVRANLYSGQTEPIKTFAAIAAISIAAHKDMPVEAVYEMTKSYWKNFKTICKQYPGVCASTPEDTVNGSLIPLHAGSIKYYKESGLQIPDRVVPPEAKK